MRALVALAVVYIAVIAAAPAPYKVVPVENGGSIAGHISYVGPKVARKEINPTVDAQTCAHNGMIQSDDLVVSSTGGIEYAVVRLTNITSGRPASDLLPTLFLQSGCMFKPHVFAVAVGAAVRERNSDGILHNVHTHSKRNPAVNFAHVPSVPDMALATFSAPESVKVTCDVHSWMSAWIWVSPHPYIVVTGADGSYKLSGVPPGQYKMEIWHETLGKVTRDVTVEAGKETRIDQSLPAAARAAGSAVKK